MQLQDVRIVVRGGGDLASGVIYRLKRAGFPVIVTELSEPLVVRRTVSFAEAVFTGQHELEGLTAVRVTRHDEAVTLAGRKEIIPVLIDPAGEIRSHWRPQVVVDAVMAKRNLLKTSMHDGGLVIGLGPGFCAGVDVHAVIETNRGHFLGRVLYAGEAEPNTGIPGLVNGNGQERVLYSPAAGVFCSDWQIGDRIEQGAVFGWIDQNPLYAEIGGCIRGLLHSGLRVGKRVKVGDIDPRCRREHCSTISDKALAIGGGVLEAVMAYVAEMC